MKRKTTSPGPRYQALIQLLRTAEELWNASRVFFARWDLSPSQFNLLNVLTDFPGGCTQSDLSRQLIMHRSNVTGLVDRLEERGLVARKENADDRRAWLVVLTPAARRLLAEIYPHYYTAAEEVWGKLPAARAEKLLTELAVISDNATRAAQANS
ncbi:MAG: MarR family transcriptional regulator [Limisphaerales bacterium]|jgi:DNA-binding MarR family transcriptional regulator